jgi:hypothetical protein
MARVAVLISAFVAGIATGLLALYVALNAAPGVILLDDMIDALTVVADRALPRFPSGSVVYVKSSLGAVLLQKLQATHSSLKLLSFSERPPEDACPTAPCERDDFLKLEVLSSPTQRTMLVAVGTSSTFGQVLLLKFWGRWRVLVNRSYTV